MADLIDRLEITELLNRHQIYIDLADADGYAGLYAANGVYESPFPAHSHQRREPGPNATPGLAASCRRITRTSWPRGVLDSVARRIGRSNRISQENRDRELRRLLLRRRRMQSEQHHLR